MADTQGTNEPVAEASTSSSNVEQPQQAPEDAENRSVRFILLFSIHSKPILLCGPFVLSPDIYSFDVGLWSVSMPDVYVLLAT